MPGVLAPPRRAARPLGRPPAPGQTYQVTAGSRRAQRPALATPVVLACLAAFVTLIYAAVVLGIGALLHETPPSVPLAVLATAIVAVTLEPVRQALHRRLIGSAYDRLADFSSEMTRPLSYDEVCPRMARLLAEATGAASVEVWLVDPGGAEGLAARWPVDAEPADRSARGVHVHDILHGGQRLGRIVRREGGGGGLSPVEQRLLADLLSSAGLALQHVQLTARLHQQIAESSARAEELRESRQRIVATADAARSRLERDIHDGAQQHLVALAVGLRMVRIVAERDPQRLPVLLADQVAAARTAVTTLSDLSVGVYPRSLAEEGVGQALRAATTASPVPVRLVDRTGRRLRSDVEAAVYFCCLEAVQNAVKHADARHIEVLLEDDDDAVRFAVCDDGGGLPAGTPPSGSGLANMRDRIDAAGGVLTVTGRPGAGTSVSGRIPVPADGAGL